ncbi:MAG: hypothetical protein NQU42_05660 [Methanothrix sp.]|uniref:hypothetical protein n=1 Tax=Methanothrix sp. TaxID=90426 RepID=UPI0025EECCA6|nr:hypothetical protein [Methanothrix sp.]MCQ8903561.1 hypothetical protein [Methanothrix sp.]
MRIPSALLIVLFLSGINGAVSQNVSENVSAVNESVSMDQKPQMALILDVSAPGAGDAREYVINYTTNILNILDPRNINFTVLTTGDLAADNEYTLFITRIGARANHEMAMNGPGGENISMGAIRKAKREVESCYICGTEKKSVVGYRPSERINESDFAIFESLGISYIIDDGMFFSANASRPYLLDNTTLYVVPVTSIASDSGTVMLSDRRAAGMNMSGDEWYSILSRGMDDAMSRGEPLVVLITSYISGSGDYMDALERFIDDASERGMSFVKVNDLVQMSKPTPTLMAAALL